MIVWKILFWIGMLGQIVIRWPYRNNGKAEKSQVHKDTTEQVLLTLLSLVLIPALIYTFSGWLDFANYTLPDWAAWLGVVMLAGSLYLFWRGHHDLAENWTPTLEIYAQHRLVTNGIYSTIRHPMYASQFLFAVAQLLFLQNWLAGPLMVIVFIPFYRLRVKAEEKMMLAAFGAEYTEYMKRTGGVLPKL
jgi:protein-S-isoprenylcysteine O-methyltransferase Ste14